MSLYGIKWGKPHHNTVRTNEFCKASGDEDNAQKSVVFFNIKYLKKRPQESSLKAGKIKYLGIN